MKVKTKAPVDFSDAERHTIIKEYLSTGKPKQQIWLKYTGMRAEHGQLLRWMRRLGYVKKVTSKKSRASSSAAKRKVSRAPVSTPVKSGNLLAKSFMAELDNLKKGLDIQNKAFASLISIARKF